MIIQLPVSNDAAQTFTTQLGANKFQFYFRWNDRSSLWVMDITDDATRVLLVASVPIVLGSELLSPYNLNIGRMIAYDESATGIEATADDFGTRVNVYWFSYDEIPA